MSTTETAAQNEWMESMLGDFLDESGQLLGRLNENLLQLDSLTRADVSEDRGRCDENLLNEMFRSAHSLKGLSAMLGLKDINNLTHRLENVFDAARKEGLIVTADVVELMFHAVDHIERLVEALKDPTAQPVACEQIVEEIHRLLEANGVERQQGCQADAEKALALAAGQAQAAAVAADPAPPAEAASPAEPESDPFAGVEDDASIADKYLAMFVDEGGLAMDRFAEALLNLDAGATPDDLKGLMHTAHQIKGSAACVGLHRAAKLAHLVEDVLQNLVDSGQQPAPVIDAMLQCADSLRQYVDNLKRGRSDCGDFGELARTLLKVQPAVSPARKPQADRPAGNAPATPRPFTGITDDLRRRIEAVAPDGAAILIGCVRFQPDLPMAGFKGQLVYEKLVNLGDVCYFEPPHEQLEDCEALGGVAFGLVTDRPSDAVCQQLRVGGVEGMEVEQLVLDKRQSAELRAAAAPSVAADKTAAIRADAPRATLATSPASAETSPPENPARAKHPSADSVGTPAETLRVDIERLDELMNLAGQLVISKARFAQFGDRLKTLRSMKRWGQSLARIQTGLGRMREPAAGGASVSATTDVEKLRNQAARLQKDLDDVREEMRVMQTIPDSINDLLEAIHQLDRVSDGIQQAVMDTRMVPIGPLFNRFKRVIRDITRANGKSIRLEINGEKTKLDKRMIDELGDPLIHMVRNSADHGIEPPEVRQAAGKPREGVVTLDAFHRGNHVVIQVRDDGAGLNTERILRKCLEKGLLNESEAQRLSPHQVHQMIWAPGLSTAEKVTEVSGRGMGMDIVKSKIELLHGTVDLESTPGQGTVLSIKLPLTLAILPSLLVEIRGDVFAIPMESVIEIVRVSQDRLATVHGRRTAWVRDRAISMVELERLFRWARQRPAGQAAADDATIVIIGEGKSELGLAVDSVLAEQDVVIKSITENYRNVPGITGASILGDGRVSLILDIAALVQMAAGRTDVAAPEEQRP